MISFLPHYNPKLQCGCTWSSSDLVAHYLATNETYQKYQRVADMICITKCIVLIVRLLLL